MPTMPFTFVALLMIVSGLTPLWGQQATLTGYIRDKRDNSPINGAQVVIKSSNKAATSNADGRYVISGLRQGQKVSAVYRKDGYGARVEDVPLSGDPTTHSVQRQTRPAGYTNCKLVRR